MPRDLHLQARADVMHRARLLAWELRKIYEDGRIHDLRQQASEWSEKEPELRPLTHKLVDLLVTELRPEVVEQVDLRVVRGNCGLVQHAWLVVEGDPNKTIPHEGTESTFTEEQMKHAGPSAAWRYIVDPQPLSAEGAPGKGTDGVIIDATALDAEPLVLLLAPYSPLQSLYAEHDRFRTVPEEAPPVKYADVRGFERAELMRKLGIGMGPVTGYAPQEVAPAPTAKEEGKQRPPRPERDRGPGSISNFPVPGMKPPPRRISPEEAAYLAAQKAKKRRKVDAN